MCDLTLALGSLIILIIKRSIGQDIVFPNDELTYNHEITKLTTTSTTISPKPEIKCPANMTLTVEPGETEGFCECLAGNLYYPRLDRCFMQYTRGPCKEHEHLILRTGTTIAKCVSNPCREKDTVLYNGQCHDLYVSGGPCEPDKTLTIPEDSYEPECVNISTVLYQVITAPLKRCNPGSRRTYRGMCRKIIR